MTAKDLRERNVSVIAVACLHLSWRVGNAGHQRPGEHDAHQLDEESSARSHQENHAGPDERSQEETQPPHRSERRHCSGP